MLVCGLANTPRIRYSADTMKKDTHPDTYRPVIFEDASSGARFLIPSTVRDTDGEAKWTDGTTHPVCRIETSSASHPVYTGEAKSIGATGRAEKFRAREKAAKSGK